MWKLIVAVVVFLVIIRVGIFVLRSLAQSPPAPPPPGEIRRVNLRYRCSICGVELKITAAPDEDPPPPRHCQGAMQQVSPVD